MSSDCESAKAALVRTTEQAATESSARAHFKAADRSFVALVDGAFADAAVRSGEHLLCSAGCSQCCVGVFAVGAADRLRLTQGWVALQAADPARALAIRTRARASWERLSPEFPGDRENGILFPESEDAFEAFGNDEVCPALDPVRGTCELYDARPHTCRVFGPPLATAEGYGVCELCFTHATPDQIVAAAMAPEPPDRGPALDALAVEAGMPPGESILAFVLASL